MNYTPESSLECIALTKIAVSLWDQKDVLILFQKFSNQLTSHKKYEEWAKIESKVLEKVPKLSLPEHLKRKVFQYINPVGLEILYWMETAYDCGLYLTTPCRFIWTTQGTIDKRKTAELLVRNDNLDTAGRFKLACICCLESDTEAIWYEHNAPFYERYISLCCDIRIQRDLVFIWVYLIHKDWNNMNHFIETTMQRKCTAAQFGFEYAAKCGNKTAAEYFFRKLTPNEREECLVRTAEIIVRTEFNLLIPCAYSTFKEDYASILCLLLSHMVKEQEREFLKKYAFEVLKCLSDWPWQRQCMKMAKKMWEFFPKSAYGDLLKTILKKVSYKDCNYNDLFVELWKESPYEFKRYAIFDRSWEYILFKLFVIKDKRAIEMILKETTAAERKKLLTSHYGYKICTHLIKNNEWVSLKFIIRKCLSF